jgi:two-component system, sensor histidine kinase and response regulator
MLKVRPFYILFLLILCFRLNAQDPNGINKLKEQIKNGKDDTLKIKRLLSLSSNLSSSEFKESIRYANEALNLSFKLNNIKGRSNAYNCLADAYWFHSDYNKAQEYYFKSYRINDSIHDQKAIAFSLYNIGWIVCIQQHNYKSDHYLYQSLSIYKSLKDTVGLLKIYNALASYYVDRYQNDKSEKPYFDSAIAYFNKGIEYAKSAHYYNDLGRI